MNSKRNIRDIILEIICIPETCRRENLSLYSSLERTGYFEVHEKVPVDAIREELLIHREYVNIWIQYSADKRCEGWFYRQLGSEYEVGLVSLKGGITNQEQFKDPSEACATFIKREIEWIRTIH